jgi:hypothetical protein
MANTNNLKTISEVAVEILEEQKKLLSIEELLSIVIDRNLYVFKDGVDTKHILNGVIKRKCINKNLSYMNKGKLFFYNYKDNQYGLTSWLTQEEINNFIEEAEQQVAVNIQKNNRKINHENDNQINQKNDREININDEQHNASGLEIISILSLVWIFFILMLFFYNEGSTLSLNAMGDYLAGFFAPVLFLWLVYGVFLQKEEFGKVVDSFELQQKEFADSVKTMKDQVVQVEVQHLNTWFNRNTRTIDNIKSNLFRNINVLNIDSMGLINEQLKDDINNAKDYINIFDELKNILSIVLYIEEHLKILSKQQENNIILIKSINELKEEFDMLMGEDIKNIKEIISIVFVLIECRNSPEYKGYNIYKHWVTNNTDIINLLVNKRKTTLEDTLRAIMLTTPKLGMQMNFETGEINGSI